MAGKEKKRNLTKAQLLKKLKRCAESIDTEGAHSDADALLVDYINDDEIRAAYNKIEKWYA